MAQCYGVDLNDLGISGDWVSQDAQRKADQQDVYEPEEGNRNVKRSEVMPMSGYEEAVYYIIEYDEQSYNDENYYKKAEVNCFIRLDDKYLLPARSL